MPAVKTAVRNPQSLVHRAGEYLVLCKPKVVLLMIFTAWVGMFLAAPGELPLNALLFGSLGIALSAGAAAALNHVIDRHIDARMYRTRNRPLPRGEVRPAQCVAFALFTGALGLAILFLFVNALTAWLTLASLIGYALVYTLWLKRATPQNIVIGGIAGATPPLLGWTAVTGQVDPYPLLLVLIIFTWTPPHFWALAIYRKEDYARVGIPMLPVTHGEDFTRLQILLYTVLLTVVTVLPWLIGEHGWLYLAGVLTIDAVFLRHAWVLYRRPTRELALKTFVYSITYLFILFALLLGDRVVLPMLARWLG
ncbi:MAG: protoheme IX farnesyltransferase [Gammaproteobacteria bacterium]|nr:MAG: protoheme IX farnesyltransferase [Gammaproteobacteria bacterium]